MLQILPFLVRSSHVLLQVLCVALVVGTEVVPVHLPPLQLKVVVAGLYVEHRRVIVLERADQHVFVLGH